MKFADDILDVAARTLNKSLIAYTTTRLEDRVDYQTVRHARTIAAKRGEKPMAWSDFKKKVSP